MRKPKQKEKVLQPGFGPGANKAIEYYSPEMKRLLQSMAPIFGRVWQNANSMNRLALIAAAKYGLVPTEPKKVGDAGNVGESR